TPGILALGIEEPGQLRRCNSVSLLGRPIPAGVLTVSPHHGDLDRQLGAAVLGDDEDGRAQPDRPWQANRRWWSGRRRRSRDDFHWSRRGPIEGTASPVNCEELQGDALGAGSSARSACSY